MLLAGEPGLDFASLSRLSRTLIGLTLFLVSVLGISCDEALPPRLEDPNTFVFTWKLEKGTCIIDSSGIYGAGAIDITFTNTYTEALQDSEFITIRLEMWLVEHPEASAHVNFYSESLGDSTLITGGILTLVPNRTAELYHQWNHKTDLGKDFYSYLHLTQKYDPLRDLHWLESDTTTLAMRGTAQIFRKVPSYAIPETKAKIVYQIY